MKSATHNTLLFAVAPCGAALCTEVAAATLTSAYEFNGDFHDAILDGHDADMVSGTRGAGAGSLSADSFVFAGNQGVSLGNALAHADSYSIELYFSFGALNQDANYRTILDPGQERSDLNLYARFNEALQFYPGPDSEAGVLLQGARNHLVFTRDSGGLVRVYANGALALTDKTSSTAAQSLADGNILHFFEDNAEEVAPGEVDYIRLYDGVLTAGDATRLYDARNAPLSTVPMPAALPLLVAALSVMGARRRKA